MEKQQGKIDKPPAVIIIARHGTRIDAVDKEWHLSSPTPYDPPLTYGGWIQGRALGARIASLLKAREESVREEIIPSATGSSLSVASSSASETAVSDETYQKVLNKVRKHKVVIHSSPFLRCIQTSVAISAGISQYYRAENDRSTDQIPTPSSSTPESEEISPLNTPSRSSTPTSADQWARHSGKDKANGHSKRADVVPKTRLRIDALLGEWLSPDYFDQITPPPNSVMMVAGAKAELLRRGESLHRANNLSSNSFSGNFPGGWKSNQSPESSETAVAENETLKTSPLSESPTSESRLKSESSHPYTRPTRAITIRDVLSRSLLYHHEDFSKGYIPPAPTYAISPSDPIPTGYVAHARDACVDVDYQWDSMRDPQNWGDGGECGEEWSTMHKRFRNGLLKMIDWYSHEQPSKSHHRYHHHHHNGEDDETDTVLVIVTHGAGCNALIGALTSQPVLIDVAMASLTMAVRKDLFKIRNSANQSPDRSNDKDTVESHISPLETSLHKIYDLSLIASTEHLRATSNPLSIIPQLPTPIFERSRPIPIYRRRRSSNPTFVGINNGQENQNPPSARGYALQRSATTNPAHHHHSRSTSGLWGSSSSITSVPTPTTTKDSSKDIIEEHTEHHHEPERRDLNPIETKNLPTGSNPPPPPQTTDDNTTLSPMTREVNRLYDNFQAQPKSQLGLWSSAAIAQAREPATKRRWTVTDRQ